MIAPRRRVLVVDDEDVVCRSYHRVLSEVGYDVQTAASGREAVEEFNKQPFDVVLADLKMPSMDGLAVTRVLKASRPQVQVIIITGYGTEESALEAEKLGVFKYLHKPLSPEVLSRATEEALRSTLQSPTTAVEAPAAPASEPPAEVEPAPAEPPAPKAMAAPTVTEARPGLLKTLAMIGIAPLAGLAYVIFLPFLGLGMLLVLGARGLARKLAPGQKA